MIFFDIDDTLTDSISAHEKAILALSVKEGLNIQNEAAAKALWNSITDEFLNLYFQKKISLKDQRTERLINFWESQGQHLSKSDAERLYPFYHHLFLANCLVFADVWESLNQVRHLPLGIISNGVGYDQQFKLQNNKINTFFSAIIISDEVAYAKPQCEIFELAAHYAQQPIKECWYVGNSYSLDYLASKAAGMQAIWLNRLNEQLPASDNEICSNFSEAINLIKQRNSATKQS